MSYNSKYTGEQVEGFLDQIANGEIGGDIIETDPIFSASPAASITDAKKTEWDNKQDKITDLDAIRSGAEKGATALQSVPSEYVTESELVWVKAEGEAGVRLKGTNGTATGNLAISAGDDKTASDGTAFASAASGDHAVAFGYGNTCAGRSTLSQGLYNTVNGKDSVAFGQRNLVNGDQAFAAGQQNEVTTRLGVAIGYKNKATNTDSIAIGYQNTSGGSASVAMGDTCEANGTSSTAIGYMTKATGAYSSTFGQNTQATNNGEVAMGLYNKSTTSTEASEQTLFSFGIGTSDTNRTNAFEIKKNGDVYVADKLLSAVATSGSYNDLSNKPTIPTALSQLNNDEEYITHEDVAAVARTGSYNDLEDKPTIPVAVTESTVSGWGFTKNTGTYSKPSGGIPKSDLDSATQQVLTTAFGDHQTIEDMSIDISDLKDEMSNTAVTQQYGEDKIAKDIDGFITRRQTVYALPDAAGGAEDDVIATVNTLKTINGESILGSGDLTIKGGAKVYEWFYDGESESVTLSQEEYDNIVEADIVVVNVGGLLSCTVDRSGKEFSEAFGYYSLSAQFDMQGSKVYLNIGINISTKLATITIEEQAIPTKTSQLENDSNFITSDNLKTINGESILGSGNISISGGSGGGGKEYVEAPLMTDPMGTSIRFSLSVPLEPNKVYVANKKVSSIDMSMISIPSDSIGAEYTIMFQTSTSELPISTSNMFSFLWADGITPTIEADTYYELSLVMNSISIGNTYDTRIFKIVLTPFKAVE